MESSFPPRGVDPIPCWRSALRVGPVIPQTPNMVFGDSSAKFMYNFKVAAWVWLRMFTASTTGIPSFQSLRIREIGTCGPEAVEVKPTLGFVCNAGRKDGLRRLVEDPSVPHNRPGPCPDPVWVVFLTTTSSRAAGDTNYEMETTLRKTRATDRMRENNTKLTVCIHRHLVIHARGKEIINQGQAMVKTVVTDSDKHVIRRRFA